MRVLVPTLLAALVLAAPAARAEDAGGAADLAATQAAAARLDHERTTLGAERAKLQARLDALAAEIAKLKAHHDAAAPLFTDPELDRRLKAAQALSARVDGLTRQQAAVDARLGAAERALLAAYDAALARVRDALAQVTPRDRDAARAALARLEAGRRQAAAALARLAPSDQSTAVPAVTPGSDDPQALEAQADLLRDTRDRLARRLATLKDRAAELERQRDLAGQMHGFLSETRLFDESDRSASRMTTDPRGTTLSSGTAGGAAGGGTSTPTAGGGAGNPAPGGGTSTGTGGGSGGTGGVGTGTGGPINGPTPGNGLGGGNDQPVRQITRADASATPDTLGRLGDDASLDDVQARMKQLQALIHRLDGKARALDARARALTPR